MVSSLPLTAVIFDCDGVLADTEPLHYAAFQEVLGPLGLGHDYDQYLQRYVGFDDRDAFLQVFRESGRSLEPSLLNDLIRAKNTALLELASKGVKTFPGVIQLVHELVASEVVLAVASGSLRREVRAFVDALGLGTAFSIIVAADDVAKSKPDPETYVGAIKRLRAINGLSEVDAKKAVAIEDTPAGIQSAKGAGLYVIGVTHSYPAGRLTGAHHVVESMTQLDVSKLTRLIETWAS